jgi:hypothetical protein
MRLRKSTYLTSAASVALIAGLAASPAQAFDDVDWQWEKNVNDNVVKEALISSEINPSGLVDVQKFQLHVGNLSSNSEVTNVTYDRVGETGDGETQTVTIDGRFDDEEVDENGDEVAIDNAAEDVDGDGINETGGVAIDSVSNASVAQDGLDVTPAGGDEDDSFELTLSVDPEAADGELDRLDATTQLPEVESSATSVANNQSVDTQVHTELNDGQLAYGSAQESEGELNNDDLEVVRAFEGTNDGIDNDQMSAALAAAVGNINGTISKASITANSTVANITNASVDSDATAVTNNMSATLNATSGEDAVMVADITQAGFADVGATSDVNNVSANNFKNMREIDPFVSSTATAVGNNLSITVTSPADSGNPAADINNSVEPD